MGAASTRRSTGLTMLSAIAFAMLTVLVLTGLTQSLDARIVQRLRPDDVWGPSQVRWSPWMSRLQPGRMYLLLSVASLASSAWRRCRWPVLLGAGLLAVSVALTLLSKAVVHRHDPHGYLAATGGAYPSGHVVALVVSLVGCGQVVLARVRWWWWAPVAAVATVMAASLLVSGAHWPTDVLGGLLLALAVTGAGNSISERARPGTKADPPPPR